MTSAVVNRPGQEPGNSRREPAEPGRDAGRAGGDREVRLKRSLGIAGLATLGAVMMSPALGIYGNWGPMAAIVGQPTPLVFLAALAISLPTAISYALVSREMPTAGSAFAWVWRTMSSGAGTWVGMLMAAYYTVAVILQPLFFGLFFNDLLGFLGVHGTGIGTWALGAGLATVAVILIAYRGIEVSTRSAVTAILCEVAVVIALAGTILITKLVEGHLSFGAFDPGQVRGSFSSFWSAMILGILSFTGYDVVSTAAEEAHAPRRLLPKATLLACIGVGLFWALGSWAFSAGEPLSKIDALNASGLTAATPIAHTYWGWGRIFVIITGMTAAFGVYLACVVGASRAVFAMARQHALPSALGKLHPTARVPWNAMHVVFAVAIAGAFGIAFLFDNPLEGFVWWAGVVVFFALITYIAVNLANIVYFRRFARERFNWWLNLVVPLAGICLDAYLIYKSFFKSLWAGTFRDGKSIVLLGVLTAVAAGAYVLALRLRRPGRLAAALPAIEEEAPQLVPATEAGVA
jgi:amino acid transporter